MEKKRVLDIVTSDPCPKCGSKGWIIDTDGESKYWLLCLDLKDIGCVETKELPNNIEIIDE